MSVKTVAIMAPGDMGNAIGIVLKHGGLRTITNLDGRSARTVGLAKKAGIEAVPDDATLVSQADIVISIMPPGEALGFARRLAPAIRRSTAKPLYCDCNAIAPTTMQEIGKLIRDAGAEAADCGIAGGPPKIGPQRTQFLTSGPGALKFAELVKHGLDVKVIPGDIGAASTVKMCFGAMSKGFTAITTQAWITAHALGVADSLRTVQLGTMGEDRLLDLERTVTRTPFTSYRWVSEMEEVVKTFTSVGLTPDIFQGVVDLYKFIAATPYGVLKPEDPKPNLTELALKLGEYARARNRAAAE